MIQFLDLQKVTALHAAEIHEATARVIDSGWYIHGQECTQFEKEYATYIGTRHCIGVGNGKSSAGASSPSNSSVFSVIWVFTPRRRQ